MSSSEVQIYNRALNAIGARNSVASTAEASREAEVCNLWYSVVRDRILAAAPWPVARAFSRLALLKERDDTLVWDAEDPEPGFRYAYAVPADMVQPRNLTTFTTFSLSLYNDGVADALAIMTNSVDPILVYTKRQTLSGLWDIGLEMAVTFGLAAFICMPLTGKTTRAKEAMGQANGLLLDARLSAANSDDNTFETIPDWISARGYAESAPSTRYIYPFGPLISATELPGVS